MIRSLVEIVGLTAVVAAVYLLTDVRWALLLAGVLLVLIANVAPGRPVRPADGREGEDGR